MPLTAADVMTREVITLTPATPIHEFARICAEDQISGAPVLSVDGRIVGIVSKSDLIPRLIEGNLRRGSRENLRGAFNLEDEDFGGLASFGDAEGSVDLGAVDEILQQDVVTVAPGDDVASVARRMSKERIHRVLVEEKGRLVGIITSLDLLGHFPEEATAPRAAGTKAKAGKPAKKAARKPAKRAARKPAKKAARKPARKAARKPARRR